MADNLETQDMIMTYLYENRRLLEHLTDVVLAGNDAGFDIESINEIFRVMHTIKGSSGIMMFDGLADIAHKLEDVLAYIRDELVAACEAGNLCAEEHKQLVEMILAVSDYISGEFDVIENGEKPCKDNSELIKKLNDFLENMKKHHSSDEMMQYYYIAPASSKETHYYKLTICFTKCENGVDAGWLKRKIHLMCDVLENVSEEMSSTTGTGTSGEKKEDELCVLIATQETEDGLKNIIHTVDDDCEAYICECTAIEYQRGFDSFSNEINIDLDLSFDDEEYRLNAEEEKVIKKTAQRDIAPGDFVIEPKGSHQKEKNNLVSVDVNKVDKLIDSVHKLERLKNSVRGISQEQSSIIDISALAESLEKAIDEINYAAYSLRKVSLVQTFRKMQRAVFDLSRRLGKKIKFMSDGAETEVDRDYAEYISDSLMHLIRNAADHGIESEAERGKLGKRDNAMIYVSAKEEGGQLIIMVADNGRGLNRENIIKKAFEKKLIEKDTDTSLLSDNEVFRFITLPGFSTRQGVTEYSGRGVGMDVVVSNLEALGGRLEIESEAGAGCCMTLVIPV